MECQYKKKTHETRLSPFFLTSLSVKKKEGGRASEGNYISVSKSRQQLELKAQKIQSNLFLITSEDRGVRVPFFHFCVYVRVCLSALCVLICVHVFTEGQEAVLCICVCILFCWCVFGNSLYAPENKGNVSNYSGFHLVDALSWLHTWTGVVSYKMYVLAPTSFFFDLEMAAVGMSEGWGTAVALCVFYSLHSRKTISTLSSRECFVQGCYGLCCVSAMTVWIVKQWK